MPVHGIPVINRGSQVAGTAHVRDRFRGYSSASLDMKPRRDFDQHTSRLRLGDVAPYHKVSHVAARKFVMTLRLLRACGCALRCLSRKRLRVDRGPFSHVVLSSLCPLALGLALGFA